MFKIQNKLSKSIPDYLLANYHLHLMNIERTADKTYYFYLDTDYKISLLVGDPHPKEIFVLCIYSTLFINLNHEYARFIIRWNHSGLAITVYPKING